MKWVAKGGKLFDPSQNLNKISDLLIDRGKIAGIGKNFPEDIPAVDCAGKIIAPGFLDMHVHLREPGREDKETILTGTRAAARGGFTAVAAMPNTHPPIDDPAGVHFVLRKAAEGPVKVFPIASISKGQEGEELSEMARLREAGAAAFSDDGKPVKTAELMRRALEYSKMIDSPIIDHCEEETMAHGVMHEGFYSTILGLLGIPAEAEWIAVARDLALAELTGGRLHVAHVSSARSVDLIRAARARGVRATAEVTIHHLLLTHQKITTYDTNCKINPPLREESDRQALLSGLMDGTIDCIVSDHAPHTREDKEVEFDFAPSGISGVEILVPLLLGELVNQDKLPLKRAVEALGIRPYEILGLPIPQIKEGNEANLTILDLEAEETIDARQFESKGKNMPYQGMTVKGLPVMTIARGTVVMDSRRIIKNWTPTQPIFSPSAS